MSTSLIPWIPQQYLNNDGNPLSGGSVFIYYAGTTNPAPSYSDPAGTVLNTVPNVVLDGAGYPNNATKAIYLDNNIVYKLIIKSSAGVTQYSRDDVSTSGSGSVSGDYILKTTIPLVTQLINTDLETGLTVLDITNTGVVSFRDGKVQVKSTHTSASSSTGFVDLPVKGIVSNTGGMSGELDSYLYVENQGLGKPKVTHTEIIRSKTSSTETDLSLTKEFDGQANEFKMYDSVHGSSDRYAVLSDIPAASIITGITNTPTVELDINAGVLQADVKIAPLTSVPDNILKENSLGLYVDENDITGFIEKVAPEQIVDTVLASGPTSPNYWNQKLDLRSDHGAQLFSYIADTFTSVGLTLPDRHMVTIGDLSKSLTILNQGLEIAGGPEEGTVGLIGHLLSFVEVYEHIEGSVALKTFSLGIQYTDDAINLYDSRHGVIDRYARLSDIESVGNNLYIRKDGLTDTTDVIPFDFGISTPLITTSGPLKIASGNLIDLETDLSFRVLSKRVAPTVGQGSIIQTVKDQASNAWYSFETYRNATTDYELRMLGFVGSNGGILLTYSPLRGVGFAPDFVVGGAGRVLTYNADNSCSWQALPETTVVTGHGEQSVGNTYAATKAAGNGTVADPVCSVLTNEAALALVGVINLGAPGALGGTSILSGAGYTNRISFGDLVSSPYAEISCPASAATGAYNYAQVYVDPANVVQYQNGPLSQIQKDANCIQLFAYTSVDGTNVTGVNMNTKYSGYNPDSLMRDLFEQIGNPKSGLGLKAGTTAQNLAIGSGKFVGMGINDVSGESKIARTVSGTNAATFYMMTSGSINSPLTALTNLDTLYYNPTGTTKTAVDNNKWTNMRVYAIYDGSAPNQMTVLVQYGPAQYTSKDLAIAGYSSESYTANANANAMYFLGVVTIEKSGLSANANFISSTKWQDGSSSGGAGSSLVGNNYGIVKNINGVANVDNGSYSVSTEAELMAAISASGSFYAQRIINCVNDILITTNNTAITTNQFNQLKFTGYALKFSGAGKINLNCPSVVILCENEVYFDANITNPFGTSTSGASNHGVKFTQLKGTSVCAVTFTPNTNCLYEKISICTTNATQSYWNNTFVASGTPTAPIALNWISFGKSACSASFTSNSPVGAILDPTISGLVTMMSFLVSSAGGGLITLFVYDMTTVYQTGNSASVLAKITFNVTRQGEVFIALDGVTVHNGVNNVTITRSTGFDWTLDKAKTYGVCLQDDGSTNWLGVTSANTGYPTAPSIPNGSTLNTTAVVSSQINAIYARMKN